MAAPYAGAATEVLDELCADVDRYVDDSLRAEVDGLDEEHLRSRAAEAFATSTASSPHAPDAERTPVAPLQPTAASTTRGYGQTTAIHDIFADSTIYCLKASGPPPSERRQPCGLRSEWVWLRWRPEFLISPVITNRR